MWLCRGKGEEVNGWRLREGVVEELTVREREGSCQLLEMGSSARNDPNVLTAAKRGVEVRRAEDDEEDDGWFVEVMREEVEERPASTEGRKASVHGNQEVQVTPEIAVSTHSTRPKSSSTPRLRSLHRLLLRTLR